MKELNDFQADIDAVSEIDAVPTILDVVCRTTGMRFAAVARVTEDRWVTCQSLDHLEFGLGPGDELKVETTICNEIRQHGSPVVIDHVEKSEAFCGHPTPAQYGFQSYISMPIRRADGQFFGTLCAIDPRPARLENAETVGMFKLFAELIGFHLDARDRLQLSETALADQQKTAELREKFIAILGHDLRNPVTALAAGARALVRTPLNEKARSIVNLMQGSTHRMSGLIDNLLDFARARLGGGIVVVLSEDAPVEAAMKQVIDELKLATGCTVDAAFTIEETVDCDEARLAQLLSNLLANAVIHGAEGSPVRVECTARDGVFELSVSNAGAAIPDEQIGTLFHPFSQSGPEHDHGLGLGLYIASEIAAAHDGELAVSSSLEETRFTFSMRSSGREVPPPPLRAL